jgi:dihydroflavonol-4-reductase
LTPSSVGPYELTVTHGKRDTVLVTGATGFTAGHCIVDLLAHGYNVRGTVRNLATADTKHLHEAIGKASGTLELTMATLDADGGWAEAAAGCDYALHLASPIPFKAPRHQDELIRPAVDGTTRVLMAARAGVRRVVCTSSLDVITRNRATAGRQRTEADWSDPAGEMPAIPPLHLAFTDVRDLAAAHRLALEVPEAKGNRYICSNGDLPMTGIAEILKAEYGPRGYKIATRPLPPWIVRVAAPFNSEAKLGAEMLGIKHDVTSAKAIRDLGWTPRPLRDSILDTAESLIGAGIVRPRKHAPTG